MPKIEQKLIENVSVPRPSLSFESIMKDLQDLSENVATKNEVRSLESKMKMLQKENQKVKADLLARETELKAAEKKRKLYYNLFHENVKVVAELKAENECLKAEIGALKSSWNGENKLEEFPTSVHVRGEVWHTLLCALVACAVGLTSRKLGHAWRIFTSDIKLI